MNSINYEVTLIKILGTMTELLNQLDENLLRQGKGHRPY